MNTTTGANYLIKHCDKSITTEEEEDKGNVNEEEKVKQNITIKSRNVT